MTYPSDTIAKARKIIESPTELKKFAAFYNLTLQAAQQLLQRLIQQPEVDARVDRWRFSEQRSSEFQGYNAGEEKGFVRGHETGLWKGIIIGALGTLVSVLAYASKANKH